MADYSVPTGGASSVTIDLNQTDTLSVNSGGTAKACTAMEGGRITVFSGGIVDSCTVSGVSFLSSGMTVVSSGLIVLDEGIGNSNTVMAGGAEHISNGGAETDASVYGVMHVSNGGNAIRTSVFNGGKVEVKNGGTLRNASVYTGGLVELQAGGVALQGTVYTGGRVVVSNGQGANAQSMAVRDGGILSVSGQASDPTVDPGGTLDILEKGYAVRAVVSGLMTVHDGGSANSATVLDGGRCVVSSGASVYNTAISSGGLVTVEDGGHVRSMTTVDGGELRMENIIVSKRADTTDPKVSGASMLVSNGGLVSVSSMTIESGALVSLDSKSTLRFLDIGKDASGEFAIAGLDEYDPDSGTCRKELDCTADDPWTENKYKTLLGCTEEVFSRAFTYRGGDLYMRGQAYISEESNGDESFPTIEAALALNPTGFVIVDGTFGASANVPTFHGLRTVISGGTFDTSVCGGNFFNDPDAGSKSMKETPVTGDISLSVEGGTFNKIFFAGDRVGVAGAVARTGDITTTISGGVFNNAVAGGMAYTYGSSGNTDGITLVGDVYLTIKGGSFNGNANNKDWIYGGCLSTTKQLAAQTTIQGNVTVTLDATNNNITIGNLVAGSYGGGVIEQRAGAEATTGNTKLVLTGGTSLAPRTVTVTGELWGGCSGDKYTVSGYSTTVSGKRTLSFSGFRGVLQCDQIRAFDHAEFVKSGSTFTSASLVDYSGGGLDMGYVENWTFEKACRLSGNFKNDFAGDTLNLMNMTPGSQISNWVIIDNGNADGYLNFSGLGIQMNGTDIENVTRSESALSWSWSGIDYTLSLAAGKMSLAGVTASTIA